MARDELYQQKLIRDVRVLEDQLYHADYENRVLIDRLQRRQALTPETLNRLPAEAGQGDRRPPDRLPEAGPKLSEGLDDPPADSVFEPPVIDRPRPLTDPPGRDAVPPVNADDIDLDFDAGTPMPNSADGSVPRPDADKAAGGFQLPPPTAPKPPAEPIPPGPEDLQFDPIEPGEVLPPDNAEGGRDEPAGQITLPPGVGVIGSSEPIAASRPHAQRHVAALKIVDVQLPESAENDAGDVQPVSADTPPGRLIRLTVAASDQNGRAAEIGVHRETELLIELARQRDHVILGTWRFDATECRDHRAAEGQPVVVLPLRISNVTAVDEPAVLTVSYRRGPVHIQTRRLVQSDEWGVPDDRVQPAGWFPRAD